MNENLPFATVSFYDFHEVSDPELVAQEIHQFVEGRDILGTIILATEGINSSLSGAKENLVDLLNFLQSDLGPGGESFCLNPKFTYHNKHTFPRFKIKIKPEIVTLGQPGLDPRKRVGTYLSPQEWNRVIQDPEVVLIDARNDYEYEVGTFRGARPAGTRHFRDFPSQVEKYLDPTKHRKVAMFCTGGIRCEKASAYLLEKGFDTVYHLQGGILHYLEQTPKDEVAWEGDCFVFDNRVALTTDLIPGDWKLCEECGQPRKPGQACNSCS
ncbi:MAG: rhodanese-related sulfurtransferase [Spirochaetales bacterium]|nr:rhodanese-related sulfurtransferase [Spirochaetales bacterium]